MGRTKKGWFERNEIQRVTLDWVKQNCKFTNREMELLQIIYDRKLVRRDHLEIISESYRKAGKNRTVLLNRAIKKMYTKMCLDKIHEAQELGRGNTPCLVALDKGGSLLLGVPHKRRISHKVRHSKGGEDYVYRSLPINFRHINGVNKTEVETILFCDSLNYQLVQWVHEMKIVFHYAGEKITLIPDILMELDIKGKKFLAFIEYDTGSENYRYSSQFPVIRDKIIKYKKCMLSDTLKKDYNYFPMLLLVTEDGKRINYFNEKCQEMGIKGFGVFHENYQDFLRHLSTII
ncbi:replication-relaxation family protein [Halobacillus rhizosphaerae]|uniref:replication-relaxation family protein n=1 Tax=Halobacillus rhizosphaerae TaxID=3064889 RepID=UPI00398B24B6